ncbi:MAG: EFR1 family ferrodoxin [Clostridiales bacterium]|nr:EFR1 family ferrodoxin [Clostridiales bacterium]
MLFYFTATGNSLYVAKQLSKNPLSIPQLLKNGELRFEDESIGIVCPVFAGEPPKIVMRFIEKETFKTDYFYMILTYGHDQSDSPEFTCALLKEFGVKVDYIGTVKLVDNYLPVFNMDEEKMIDKRVDGQIETIKAALSSKLKDIPIASDEGRKLHAMVANMGRQNPSFNNGEQIKVTEDCIGCGVCAKVCPIGDLFIKDGMAARKSKTCEFCLACANNCPQKAIVMNIMDKNPNARYRNENISLEEIIAANNQSQ